MPARLSRRDFLKCSVFAGISIYITAPGSTAGLPEHDFPGLARMQDMPGFGADGAQVAALATWLRQRYGGQAAAVDAAAVRGCAQTGIDRHCPSSLHCGLAHAGRAGSRKIKTGDGGAHTSVYAKKHRHRPIRCRRYGRTSNG